MNENNLKNCYKAPPQDYHNAVLASLNTLPDENTARRKVSRPFKIVVAVAIVLALGTTSVFAATTIYSMIVSKQGNYGLNLSVNASTSDTAVKSKSWDYVKLNVGYLPDGMVEIPNTNKVKYSDNSKEDERVISFFVDKVDDNYSFTESGIKDYKECEVNGNKAIIASRVFHEGEDSNEKMFYIYYKNEGFLLGCFLINDFTDTEIDDIMQNVTLSQGTAEDFSFDLSSYTNTEETPENMPKITYCYNFTKAINYNEYINVSNSNCSGENAVGLCVNSINVYDNVSEFNKDNFESYDHYSDFFDESGNVLPFTKDTYKIGDGINSMDELISSKEVDRSFVLVSLNLVNNTDTEQYYAFNDFLSRLTKDSQGNLKKYEEAGDTYSTDTLGYDIPYIDADNGGALQKTIEANGSANVKLGFFVERDTLDDLYFTVETSTSVKAYTYTYDYAYIKVTQ